MIAPVATPDGLPLTYEVLPGSTADSNTLRMLQDHRAAIRQGAAGLGDGSRRAEAMLAEMMRNSDPAV
jgi:hypothetical protein